MRGRTISKGEEVEVDDLERGKMLLYSRAEWLARYARAGHQKLLFTFLITTMVSLWLYLVGGAVLDISPVIIVLSATVTVLVFLAFDAVYVGRTRSRARGEDSFPALYEHGVQVNQLSTYRPLFVPYGEISSYKRWRQLNLDSTRFDLRRSKRRVTAPCLASILGTRGLLTMLERITRKPPEKRSPKLVIYGRQSSMTMEGPSSRRELG